VKFDDKGHQSMFKVTEEFTRGKMFSTIQNIIRQDKGTAG